MLGRMFERFVGHLNAPLGCLNILPNFCALNFLVHVFLQNKHMVTYISHSSIFTTPITCIPQEITTLK